MEQKWITDRLPTAADGDIDGDVRMRPPGGDRSWIVHWSFVCRGMDWLHTGLWEPPAQPASTEPDRIAALEQRVAEHIRAQSLLTAALIKRIEALEGVPTDGAIPENGIGVAGGITALERRITELTSLFWAHSHPAVVEPTTDPQS
jgi:hypothetical protein